MASRVNSIVPALVWILAATQAAFAQSPGEAAKAVAGTWEMSNAERDRSCTVTFKSAAGTAAASVSWDAKCTELFPFSRSVVSWSVGERETIRLVDAKGQPVLELSEVEGGLYEGERRGEGLVFLQSVAAGAAEERKPATIAGEWAFTGASGRPLCRATLTTTPAAASEALELKLKPGCAAIITDFGPVAWLLDRGQLVLVPARGDVWRFEETEPSIWQRIPQLRQPLRLVKQ
jgi:hypothetical protein